jgi:hypothetical protein
MSKGIFDHIHAARLRHGWSCVYRARPCTRAGLRRYMPTTFIPAICLAKQTEILRQVIRFEYGQRL